MHKHFSIQSIVYIIYREQLEIFFNKYKSDKITYTTFSRQLKKMHATLDLETIINKLLIQ